jgi:hypothetical protein
MAEVPTTVRDHVSWLLLKQVDEHGRGLTQWEIDFVEQLHGWLRAGRHLTDKQARTLERIREERCGNE